LDRETHQLNQEFDIFPLGDSAVTMDLGNTISKSLNSRVRNIGQWLMQHPLNGCKDVIAGYSSVSILYDPVVLRKNYLFDSSAFEFMKRKLEQAWKETINDHFCRRTKHSIPCAMMKISGSTSNYFARKIIKEESFRFTNPDPIMFI
jgi:inhibitor of KinA